ncbi:hypothetical protein ACVGXO_03505, partial [Enterobacter hormaechei]
PGLRGREGAVFARWGVALRGGDFPFFVWAVYYMHTAFFFFFLTSPPTPTPPNTPPRTPHTNTQKLISKNTKKTYYLF